MRFLTLFSAADGQVEVDPNGRVTRERGESEREMDVRVRWRKKLNCWRLLELSDRARAYLRRLNWPVPVIPMDVEEDEGCAVIGALQDQGFTVEYEHLTRTKKRRQRKTA